MEAKSGRSTRVCAGQVEAVHDLECRKARKETISLSESRTPSKGKCMNQVHFNYLTVAFSISHFNFKLVTENLLFTSL